LTTFVDLEFDTPGSGGAPLGDIASSLVSLDDLLRDLGTIAAYPSSVEFREVRVVAIELRNPLKVRLSLVAIPVEAVKAFQEICGDIIAFRQRRPPANIAATLDRVLRAIGREGQVTDTEAARLHGHIMSLHNAAVPLKRVVVREA
jgi:hypothetical protein